MEDKKTKLTILSTGVNDELLEKVKVRLQNMEIKPSISGYLKFLILKDLKENGGESNEST